jgi:hypothetical protein
MANQCLSVCIRVAFDLVTATNVTFESTNYLAVLARRGKEITLLSISAESVPKPRGVLKIEFVSRTILAIVKCVTTSNIKALQKK